MACHYKGQRYDSFWLEHCIKNNKRNLGGGRFEPAKPVTPKPSFSGLGSQLQILDLDADGSKQLVNMNHEPKGYFELSDTEEWQAFRPFEKYK
jgi:hypothetical protein